MRPSRWIAIDPRSGVVLHVDVEEAEAARFAKHHQKNTGDRPMVVGWAPGELMVLDEGAIA